MNRMTPEAFSPCGLSPVSPGPGGPGSAGGQTKEFYSGTIIAVSGGYVSTGFILSINARTSDQDAERYLSILNRTGQDGLLNALAGNDLGFIAETGQPDRKLLAVRESAAGDQRRIAAVFEQGRRSYEVRGGHRSVDYPFSILELVVDERGHGLGTFVALAQVKIARTYQTDQLSLEIGSFGSFPARVRGVLRHPTH